MKMQRLDFTIDFKPGTPKEYQEALINEIKEVWKINPTADVKTILIMVGELMIKHGLEGKVNCQIK